MNRSESIKELATALAKVQKEIKGAVKDRDNPAFRGSKYADLSAVWEAWQEVGPDNGLSVVQMPGLYSPADKTMEMDVLLMHSSGEWIDGTMSVPLGKVDVQGYGSCVTYSRRYSLAAVAGICPEDDDGNAASRPEPAVSNDRAPAPQTRPARAKPEALTGPMKTRSEARIKYGEIVRELHACGDEDTLDAYLDTVKAEVAQFERELPDAWKGDGADFKGLRWEIDQARISCAGQELVNRVRAG